MYRSSMIFKHIKEIEMAMMGSLVRYTIPMYFEQRYIMLENPGIYMKNGNLILELPVMEKITSNNIECLAKEKSCQPLTKLR